MDTIKELQNLAIKKGKERAQLDDAAAKMQHLTTALQAIADMDKNVTGETNFSQLTAWCINVARITLEQTGNNDINTKPSPADTDGNIAIILEGGLVQDVVATDPQLVGRNVQIIDYDVDDADPDESTVITGHNGRSYEAYTHTTNIESPRIQLPPDVDTGKNCYTVIGFWSDTNQRFMDHIEATSGDEAERVVVEKYDTLCGCSLVITGTIVGCHDAADTKTHIKEAL